MKELLDAIRSTDDDQPKLVYADWLEQQGNIDRANLIRHQCTVAAHPAWDRRHIEAQWEVDVLLAAHAKTWRAELPQFPGVQWLDFERGFVTSVAIDVPETLYKHEASLRAAAPIAKVVLAKIEEPSPAPDDLDWLHTLRVTQYYRMKPHASASLIDVAPVLELGNVYNNIAGIFKYRNRPLERLIVDGAHPVGGVIATALVENQSLTTKLRELRVGTTFVDQDTGYYEDPTMKVEGAQAVATLRLATLEVLDIARQRVTDKGLAQLVESLPALRELDCSGCELRSLDVLAAPGSPLVRLVASHNNIASAGALAIATSPRTTGLESLALDTCEVSSTGIGALVKAPCWHTLRELDLSRNPLGANSVQILAAAQRPAHLHTLKLANCDFSEESANELGACAWLDQLVVADFSANAVAQRMIRPSMRVLSLARSRATELELGELWPHAISLDLSGLDAAIAHAPMLQVLHLQDCKLSLADLKQILTFPHLRVLDLAGCTFDDREGALDYLRTHGAGRVETLDLRRWNMTIDEVLQLARSPLVTATKTKLHGDPWTAPREIREELVKLLGPHWNYHADEPEAGEED